MFPPTEITLEQTRERAYELWERNHRAEGLEIEFWLTAERELRAERDRRFQSKSADDVMSTQPGSSAAGSASQ